MPLKPPSPAITQAAPLSPPPAPPAAPSAPPKEVEAQAQPRPKKVLVRARSYPLWVHRQGVLVPVGSPVPLDLDPWVQIHIDAGGLEVVTL